MPYNVITITCTVFALYFGSVLNALRRRVGEEERLLSGKGARKAGPLTLMISKLSAKLRGKPWEPPKQSESGRSSSKYKLLRGNNRCKLIPIGKLQWCEKKRLRGSNRCERKQLRGSNRWKIE
ncbi:GPI transamidase component PIG-T-like [Salvia divinorum]|uniref:GPI transamidase component PIG-T-like n=1 Tax=Salvia divinorum TaxID=28513 RepID=A0ABD1I6P6_SALDI